VEEDMTSIIGKPSWDLCFAPRYGHRVNCRTLPAGHPAGRPWI